MYVLLAPRIAQHDAGLGLTVKWSEVGFVVKGADDGVKL